VAVSQKSVESGVVIVVDCFKIVLYVLYKPRAVRRPYVIFKGYCGYFEVVDGQNLHIYFVLKW